MDRASAGARVKPFNRTMRLMASSQPSGVARSQEIRSMLLLASRVLHPPRFEITSGSVTGIPSTGAGWALGVAGALPFCCACAANAADKNTRAAHAALVIVLSLVFYSY